jgi:hypothetical protein
MQNPLILKIKCLNIFKFQYGDNVLSKLSHFFNINWFTFALRSAALAAKKYQYEENK